MTTKLEPLKFSSRAIKYLLHNVHSAERSLVVVRFGFRTLLMSKPFSWEEIKKGVLAVSYVPREIESINRSTIINYAGSIWCFMLHLIRVSFTMPEIANERWGYKQWDPGIQELFPAILMKTNAISEGKCGAVRIYEVSMGSTTRNQSEAKIGVYLSMVFTFSSKLTPEGSYTANPYTRCISSVQQQHIRKKVIWKPPSQPQTTPKHKFFA